MKVTKFGPGSIPKPLGTWSSGVYSVNSNFTTDDGGLSATNFVQLITSNGSNALQRPIVNFAAGSNIALSASSNTITITGTGVGNFVTVTGGGGETVQAHGGAGATETIDLANGNWHSLTLTADCAVTVTGFTAASGDSALVKVTQDGTGGWAITWDADIVWAGDDQPAQAAGDISWFVLVSDEGDSTIYGFPVGGASEAAIRDIGHWEVLVSGTAPPVAISNPDDDDWLYGWVAG